MASDPPRKNGPGSPEDLEPTLDSEAAEPTLDSEAAEPTLDSEAAEPTLDSVAAEREANPESDFDSAPTRHQVKDHAVGAKLLPGQRIGPYRLVRPLGEGGMGEVWQAEQQEPVRRQVALKLVKWGMDTRAVIGRFESERHALALMDHPAIARVFDAGATESGRPYFVMELVRGEPITRYCDRYRLATPDRLQLMRQVCDGVQHAHQKGVIHRDLKPSNVLVTQVDDRPVVKIIDFGIAKATAQRLTEHTVFTQMGQWVGTPVYMSPEQAEPTGLDVDTRSDVYSLGVLLYELLVGVPPLDPSELRRAGFEEIRRRIRDTEPPRPSTRITTRGDDAAELARRRSTEPAALARRLRGDLDWITLKALEKDRTRRYASASELSADIERSLRDEPVLASPPSVGYRTHKFVRRHRLAVGFAAAVAVLLLALVASMAIQSRRVARERDRANLEAKTAQEISEFLVGLFEEVDPTSARGNEITAREVLDRGVRTIQEDLGSDPATRADLMKTMGRVYTALGLYEEARPLIEDSVEIREGGEGGDPLELAAALDELAKVMHWQGEYETGLPVARRALELRESLQGSDHPDLGHSLNGLGNLLEKNDLIEEAKQVHQRAADLREAALGPDHPDLSQSLHNLAILYFSQADYERAEELLLRSAEIEEKNHGPQNYAYATSLHVIAILYETLERYDEAIPIEERALEIRERVLGENHPHVSFSLTTLANLYRAVDRPRDGEPLLRRAIEIGEASWDLEYGEVRWMYRSLAECLAEQGRTGEAEEILVDLVQRTEELGEGFEAALIPTLVTLGEFYSDQRRDSEARLVLERALEIEIRVSGAEHPFLIGSLLPLADLARRGGDEEEALRHCSRALDLARSSLPAEDPSRLAAEDACDTTD